jgi:hypothetical protein
MKDQAAPERENSAGKAALYLAFELSRKKWKLGFSDGKVRQIRRFQPNSKLTRWYKQRFGDGGGRMRRIGIVAMARRLVIDLWRYVEFGVVPEGARLKVPVASSTH